MAGWTAPRRIFLALQVLSLQGKPAILTHHTYAGCTTLYPLRLQPRE